MFQGFGHEGLHEAGATLEYRVSKGTRRGTAFADLVWKPTLLLEMKRRGEDLSKHYRQAFDYWARLVPNRPRWVILCNFDEFWVYDFENQMDTPLEKLQLTDLPGNWGPLTFLFAGEKGQEEPVFGNDQRGVTRLAAEWMADCFNSMLARGVEQPLAQRFILQMLAALFSEDIGLLDRYLVTKVLRDCKRPRDSYDLLGQLFVEMNTRGRTAGGRFKGVDYFNGGLFAHPARVELSSDEVDVLRLAADENWSNVRPEIFGTLFEHSLSEVERHKTGSHFTAPADIMRVIGPTIVEPWEQMIEGAKTQRELRHLHARMQTYKVLDPACGSGNFLYLAYRELKRLEARIWSRVSELSTKQETGQREFGFVTASQFFGIDNNPFAVELAKVTIMIGRKLAIDELQINESALPLHNLDENFRTQDAVLTEDGRSPTWPEADVVIGNPPYLDARKITQLYGRDYTAKLRKRYPEVPGRADFCVYWFRKAHDAVPSFTEKDPVRGRVGLVGTNTIRQNYSREGGLDHVVATGGTIVDAVASQVWSGAAAVNVSIVNWVKGPYTGKRVLHEQAGDRRDSPWVREEVPAITSALRSGTDVSQAKDIAVVVATKLCFEGQQPGHKKFRMSAEEFRELRRREPNCVDVIFPYLNGTSLLGGKYRDAPELVIDFGDRTLLQASKYPLTLKRIEQGVLPKWKENAAKELHNTGKPTGEHQNRLKTWWQLKRRREEMLSALEGLSRYIVCVRHTKRPIFEFLEAETHPDSALTVFAFDDDYSFGILQSDVHWEWFVARCSSLKRDFRYTNETVFDAFPWPQRPTRKEVQRVAKCAVQLRNVRNEALDGLKGGLRALYRLREKPGTNALNDAHDALNKAVMAAYRFRSNDDILARLAALNEMIALDTGATPPGIPPGYRAPDSLVTDDCVHAGLEPSVAQ